MSYIPRFRVELVREGSVKAVSRAITSPADADALFRSLLGAADRECFALLLLDTRNQAVGLNIVSVGTLNASLVHPREVFKPALLANAAAILVAHNHPSGDPDPSKEDLALTARLKQAGELLGIPLLDHLVIGDGRFVSLKERGLL